MKSKTIHHLSLIKILENLILLALVTFLLGTAATYSSAISTTIKTDTGGHKSMLRSLGHTFLGPYASSWKKIAPYTPSWGNNLVSVDLLIPRNISAHLFLVPPSLLSAAFRVTALPLTFKTGKP